MDEVKLAKLFHQVYEDLAPSFGYETRTDTKEFDEDSKNGKLMIATCKAILPEILSSQPEPPVVPMLADIKEALTIALSLWKIAHSPIGVTQDAMVEYKRRIDKLTEIVYPK